MASVTPGDSITPLEDLFNRIADDAATNLAAAIDTLTARQQSDIVAITIAAGQDSGDSGTITFDTAFAATPSIVTDPRSTQTYTSHTLTATASTCTIRCFRPDGASTAAAATVNVNWTASAR